MTNTQKASDEQIAHVRNFINWNESLRIAADMGIVLDELARLRADAARYQWLREQRPGVESPWIAVGIPGRIFCFNVEYADELIDKHMSAAPAGDKGE